MVTPPRNRRRWRIGNCCPSGPTAVTSAPRASAWHAGYGRPTRMRKPNLSCRLQRSWPKEENRGDKPAATLPEAGARAAPRLSIVILPFLNIGGSAEDDPFVDGITE